LLSRRRRTRWPTKRKRRRKRRRGRWNTKREGGEGSKGKDVEENVEQEEVVVEEEEGKRRYLPGKEVPKCHLD